MFGGGTGGCGKGGGRGGGQGLGKGRRVHRAAAFVENANPESVAAPTVLSASTGPLPAVAYVVRAVRVGQCTACGACEAACPQSALTVDGTVTVDESQCTACGECVDACAFDVLSLQPR